MDKLQLRVTPEQADLIIMALTLHADLIPSQLRRIEAAELAARITWRRTKYFGRPDTDSPKRTIDAAVADAVEAVKAMRRPLQDDGNTGGYPLHQ